MNIKNWQNNKQFIAINVLVLGVLILVFPLLVLAVSSTKIEIKQLKAEVRSFRKQQRAQKLTNQQAQDYYAFADDIKKFHASAISTGIEEKLWNKHEVSIVDREIDYDELQKVVEKSQSNLTQYFVPKLLVLKQDHKKNALTLNKQITLTLSGTYLIHKNNYYAE